MRRGPLSRLRDVPCIDVELLDRSDLAAAGAGEMPIRDERLAAE